MKLPQFTLRDLLWLVLVVGIGCAWWAHSRRLLERTASLEQQRGKLLHIASYFGVTWELKNDVVTILHLPEKPVTSR